MQKMECSLLLLLLLGFVELSTAGRKSVASNCSKVKQSFLRDKPKVAATIPDAPTHDGSLELCRFTNHTANMRPSCCTHDTERELLLTASAEYSTILLKKTTEVVDELAPGHHLKHHFIRMLALSKRMTEYELGSMLYLPHLAGRRTFNEFYAVLDNILLSYDRNTSVFKAMDNLLDELFVYVVREAATPGSRAEPDPVYSTCLKQQRRSLRPSPFPVSLENQATSLHYSAVAASYLSEAMDVTFQALNATRDLNLTHHCHRDLMKLNHCQKCYGYTELRPCQEFCEDVFMICLNRVIRLDNNWEYHRKIVKILAEYILSKVDLQSLLNVFHTEFKAGINLAIIAYPTYKKQLEKVCGPLKSTTTKSRLKVWSKPSTTSYEGDFSGDLRRLVVNLELKIQGFYSNLHSSICASEPKTGLAPCWDGLTERANKKKIILEFVDEFAPYPDKNEEVTGLIDTIKRIRNEVLTIFLRNGKGKQGSEDALEGSGSGDGNPSNDDEPDDTPDTPTSTSIIKPIAPLRSQVRSTVAGALEKGPSISQPYGPKHAQDNSIEIVDEKTTPKTVIKLIATKAPPAAEKSEMRTRDNNGSSGHILRLSSLLLWLNVILVISYAQH